ncbi:hypothetical protein [Halomonas salina]|nr:hypothetical protein [Halomonas salina]
MTVFSWMIVAFGTLMAGVCAFTYVQIERNAHQARQQQATSRDSRDLPRH